MISKPEGLDFLILIHQLQLRPQGGQEEADITSRGLLCTPTSSCQTRGADGTYHVHHASSPLKLIKATSDLGY